MRVYGRHDGRKNRRQQYSTDPGIEQFAYHIYEDFFMFSVLEVVEHCYCDKADGVRYLRDKYEATFGSVTTIVLGDAPNDTAMLKEADIGILMARPDGSYEDVGGGAGNIIKAKGSGSLAWSEAVINAIGRVKD